MDTTLKAARPLLLTEAETTLGGRRIRYTLRYSARARRVGAWIRPETGLVVTLPADGTAQQAKGFLRRYERWVVREFDRWTAQSAALPRPWPYGSTCLYRGEAHRVLIRKASPGGVDHVPPAQLLVRVPSASLEGARRVLRSWLTCEAGRVLPERVETFSTRMGLQARRIYVRNLRRSWGNCWPGRSLSFNYRLIMAPPAILDYVVVHELAHLKERNHSRRFWALVAAHCPAHDEAKRWLRAFDSLLAV